MLAKACKLQVTRVDPTDLLGAGATIGTSAAVTVEGQVGIGFAEGLGLETDDDGLVVVDRSQRASIEGVYAAGDITPGFRQLAVAAGAGTVAASVINRDLIARER